MEETEYKCNICNKFYKNNKSLWKHKYVYHKPQVIEVFSQNTVSISATNQSTNIEASYKCKYCPKIYKHLQSRWKHEIICKKIYDENQLRIEKEFNEKVKNELNEKIEKEKAKSEKEKAEMKAEMEKLRKLIDKANKKIYNKTNNINNGVINNIQINAVGSENIIKKLTNKEKIDLITSPMFKEKPVVNLVKKVYNEEKFEEDRNTILNNLRSKSCLTFNDDTRQFDAINKNNHLDNIINCRKDDIKKLFDQMETKLKPLHKKIYEEYMENIDNEETMKIHKEEIMYILYNCKTFMNDLKNKLEEMIEEVSDEIIL